MEHATAMAPILVIEDDRNIRTLVVRYLENAGFSTISIGPVVVGCCIVAIVVGLAFARGSRAAVE